MAQQRSANSPRGVNALNVGRFSWVLRLPHDAGEPKGHKMTFAQGLRSASRATHMHRCVPDHTTQAKNSSLLTTLTSVPAERVRHSRASSTCHGD
jgi:hypothetical protein